MAYYTANYIKKLIKEDANEIQKFLTKKDTNFRDYIDASLPFTLYVDINEIAEKVVTKNSKFVTDIVEDGIKNGVKVDADSLVKNIIDAYKATINYYIDNTPKVSMEDFERKINLFNEAATGSNSLRAVINQEFSKTFILDNSSLSKRDKSVLIISPRFNTIQKAFGVKFKELFLKLNKLSEEINFDTMESEQRLANKAISTKFGTLQNLGHIEVDIISSTTNEVKRGIVTPKLLQALVSLPNSVNPEKLVRSFSKETKQSETRVIVRKKFDNSRLVLEMLIESGFMIGTIENPQANNEKSKFERLFTVGAGLTEAIRKDKNFLLDLETSKSIKQFVVESVLATMRGKQTQPYTSETVIVEKIKTVRSKVKLDAKKNSTQSTPKQSLRDIKGRFMSTVSIKAILQSLIEEQIKKNMGDGDRKDILNYRTGRFAKTVKIENVTLSREGMVSVFYNYMKYPYATFSAGGMRSQPKSRDPKLLISKSIRDVGSQLISNRMRAILV